MVFAFRHQPLKTLYTLGSVVVLLFIRLPAFAIIYAIPSTRPRPTWTYGRSLILQGFRAFITILYNTSLMQAEPPEKAAASSDKTGFVWVEPAPELVVGDIQEMAKTNNVEAVRTCGFWVGPRGPNGEFGQKASPNEKVIYHLHGGGFVMGTGNPTSAPMKALYDGFLEHFPHNPRIFALEYRISSAAPFPSANPFPAALIDALAGYKYLVHTQGFQPQNIMIGGDSAGGTLAWALAHYLAINRFPDLPNAGSVMLLSPTVDWANTHVGKDSSMAKFSTSDYVQVVVESGYTRRALLGNVPESEAGKNVWIAPASLEMKDTKGLFADTPATCIVAGGAEQTLDAMVTLHKRLVADNGESNVTYIEVPDATHDCITAPWHEPERTNALKELAVWAGKCWGPA